MPQTLSNIIRLSVPTLRIDAATNYDKAGSLCIEEAQLLISTKILQPTAIPSKQRILDRLKGTEFANTQFFSYDRMVALSVAFDTAQIAVQSSLSTSGNIIPPEPSALYLIMSSAFLESVNTTKQDKLIYATAQTLTGIAINTAIVTFIINCYF